MRDGHLPFLEQIMTHPRVKFAFNSGISKPNIIPIMTKIFNKDDKMYLVQDHLYSIFDQTFCDKSKVEKYGFVRNLKKIWYSDVCKESAKHDGI